MWGECSDEIVGEGVYVSNEEYYKESGVAVKHYFATFVYNPQKQLHLVDP